MPLPALARDPLDVQDIAEDTETLLIVGPVAPVLPSQRLNRLLAKTSEAIMSERLPPVQLELAARRAGGEAANFWFPLLESWGGGTRSLISILEVFVSSRIILSDASNQTCEQKLRREVRQ